MPQMLPSPTMTKSASSINFPQINASPTHRPHMPTPSRGRRERSMSPRRRHAYSPTDARDLADGMACTRRGTGLGAVTGSTPARCSTIAVVMLTTDTLRHIAGHQTIATVMQIAVVTTSRWLGSPGDRCRLGCPMATSPGMVRAGLQTCTYANRCSQRLHPMNRATQRTKTGASNHRCLPCDNTIKTISAQTCQVGWPRPLSWPRPISWPRPVG
jgi:hypothetical protein